MAKPLLLETHHTPSMFNKDMIVGGLIGSLVTPIAGTLIGAGIGGYVGKRTQEKENREGKPVGEPSFWNKDTLIGGFAGNIIGTVGGLLAFGAIAGVGITTVAAGTATVAAPILAVAALTMIGSAIGGTVLGAYLGGKRGERQQAQEYELAQKQTVSKDLHKGHSPEVAHAVEYAMEHDKSKNWAKHIREEQARVQEAGHEHDR